MRFSQDEIDAARRLKLMGLDWVPSPGHYVYDEVGVIEKPSPFQDRVYFILDLKHFLRRTGCVESLKTIMLWLPTWHDTRGLMHAQGISDFEVAEALRSAHSIETGSELITLYGLLEKNLAMKPNHLLSGAHF